MGQIRRKRQSSFWLLMVSLAVSFSLLIYPLLVLLPSKSQGVRELAVALAVLRARPFIEILCVMVALLALVWYRRSDVSGPRCVLFTLAALLVGVFAGLSFINVYEMKFHPAGQPDFIASRDAKLDSNEKVISVRVHGAARAYPIRSMAYHHIVNDVVAGVPIAATY
jgi:hypothetical protein